MESRKGGGFLQTRVLLGVILLGILATIFLNGIYRKQLRARDTQRKADLARIGQALEQYRLDIGRYPGGKNGKIVACPVPTGACSWGGGQFGNGGLVYTEKLPKDPVSEFTYFYRVSEDGLRYQLFARLENLDDGDIVLGLGVDCGVSCNFGVTGGNVKAGEPL